MEGKALGKILALGLKSWVCCQEDAEEAEMNGAILAGNSGDLDEVQHPSRTFSVSHGSLFAI